MFPSNAQHPDGVSDHSARCVEDTLTIALVELDEGPWGYASIEVEVPLISTGPVRVHFQPSPRQNRFPVFKFGARPRQPPLWRAPREIVATGNHRQEAAAPQVASRVLR